MLAVWPVRVWEESLFSKPAFWMLKYFSMRFIWEQDLSPEEPYILVAPPHGVFPFGNVCTMIAMPRVGGFSFNGLAASVIFYMPIFRQIVTWIGGEDASRKNAERLLGEKRRTVGISSGGVAEIFETNSDNETIILRKRYGLVKLAFRTGAPLVPCYLYGNNQTLSCWYDSSGIMQWLSRTLRFSLFFFWGRFFLPIPFRTPITGVMGLPIRFPFTSSLSLSVCVCVCVSYRDWFLFVDRVEKKQDPTSEIFPVSPFSPCSLYQ